MRDAGAVDFVAKGRLDPDLVEIVVRCRASPPAPQARPPTEPLNNARHSAPALTPRTLNSKATAGGTTGRVPAAIAAASRMRA